MACNLRIHETHALAAPFCERLSVMQGHFRHEKYDYRVRTSRAPFAREDQDSYMRRKHSQDAAGATPVFNDRTSDIEAQT